MSPTCGRGVPRLRWRLWWLGWYLASRSHGRDATAVEAFVGVPMSPRSDHRHGTEASWSASHTTTSSSSCQSPLFTGSTALPALRLSSSHSTPNAHYAPSRMTTVLRAQRPRGGEAPSRRKRGSTEDEASVNESSLLRPGRRATERQEQRRRSSSFSPSSSTTSTYFLGRSMLKHDLLTKDREQALGNSIVRAMDVRKRLEPLIEERRLQQKLAQEQRESVEDYVDDDDDDRIPPELSVYGLGSYAEDEQFQASQRLSWLASKEVRLQTQEDRNARTFNLARPIATRSFFVDDLDLHLLTTGDMQSIGLAGGFEELEALLLEGAMARQALMASNVRLVVSIAKKWSKQMAGDSSYASASLAAAYGGSWDRPSLDEVIQEGILGLSQAVDRFDPKRNLRFATYATFWITNMIRRCFQRASTGTVVVPVQYYDTKRRYMALLRKYSTMGMSDPGLEVMAGELGTTVPRLARILLLTQPPLSTDMPFMRSSSGAAGKAGGGTDIDNSLTIAETLIDSGELSMEERVDLSFLRESLECAMASELAPHERDILRLRLGLDDGISRTVPEVVQEFDSRVTAFEVRNIEQRAYKKLRSLRVLRALISHLDFAGIDRATVTIR